MTKEPDKEEEKEEILSEEEFCYYSGLPSPMAYQSDENQENKK